MSQCTLYQTRTLLLVRHSLFRINLTAFSFLGGSKDPAALVTLGSIGGISSKQNNVSGKSLNSILSTKLGVSGSRIYINFVDLPAANVAHNGRTFG